MSHNCALPSPPIRRQRLGINIIFALFLLALSFPHRAPGWYMVRTGREQEAEAGEVDGGRKTRRDWTREAPKERLI